MLAVDVNFSSFCPYILKDVDKILESQIVLSSISSPTPLNKNMSPCETCKGEGIKGGECPTCGAKRLSITWEVNKSRLWILAVYHLLGGLSWLFSGEHRDREMERWGNPFQTRNGQGGGDSKTIKHASFFALAVAEDITSEKPRKAQVTLSR